AENDLPTDNAIAKEITDGKFELVLTASTLSTQAVANANKAGKAIHVFGAVADPFSAGIGVRREAPMDHPRHLVGIGTFMPVAADAVVAAAKKARIPVFTLTPPTAKRGALFDLGANFTTIGRQTGELAVKILRGASPAGFAIEDRVPERLVVNRLALAGLKDPWRVPDDVLAHADTLIDEAGTHEKAAPKSPSTNIATA